MRNDSVDRRYADTPTMRLSAHTPFRPYAQTAIRPRAIVVATDGRAASDAALLAAHRIAPLGAFGVVTVLSTSGSSDCPTGYVLDRAATADAAARIRAQFERLFGSAEDVYVETRSGYPPAVLAAYAETHDIDLLIVGIGRPKVIDRLLGDESTLRLARMSKTPIFAVASGSAVPPRRVVVGIDFTATSIQAAHLAVELAAPDAELVLAHVETPDARSRPDASLRRVVEVVQTGFCGRVSGRLLHGDAATELLALSLDWDADAIAIGLHGHGPEDRAAIGNVATRVVRCASCSVIVAPRNAS
jgi:nucleotide-binding universal stress UspA family protein